MKLKLSEGKADVVWGIGAQAMNMGAGFLILPVALHYFSTDEMGFWFVLLALNSFVLVMDFGFGHTIARNIIFLLGGAQSITSTGFHVEEGSRKEVNLDLLAQLFRAAVLIYFTLATVTFAAIAIGGYFYINTLKMPSGLEAPFRAAWMLFGFGACLNLYFGYFNSILLGFKKARQVYQVGVIGRLVFLISGVFFVTQGYGLMGLGFAQVIMAVLDRALCSYFVNKNELYKQASKLKVLPGAAREAFNNLWYNAKRTAAVNFGSALATRANVFIVSTFLGLEVNARFGLTLQIFNMLANLSTTIFIATSPHFSHAWLEKRHQDLKRMLSKLLLASWTVYICGAIFILIFGRDVLSLIGHSANLLENKYLIFISIYLLLDVTQTDFIYVISAKNEIPYVKAVLISGMTAVAISLLAVGVFDFGIWGLIVPQACVQLAYNNWKWPGTVLKELKTGPLGLFRA